MIITTRITWSWTGELLEHQWFEYSGTVDLCKGDNTAKQAEQQQMAFQQQLMQVFSAQYGKQSAQLDYLNSILKPIAENPRGYDPATLTAMRTSASDTIAQNTAQAKQAIQADMAARGGGTGLPSGVDAQISAQLANSSAAQQAAAQRDITVQDANLKQVNFWNAIQGLSGNTGMLNPIGYAGSANQAGGTVANLSQAVTASQQSGWLNAALGGLGGAAGGFLGGPAFAKMATGGK